MQFIKHALTTDFKIIVDFVAPPAIDNELAALVDANWQKQQASHDYMLFNGKMLSVVEFTGQALFGRFVDYKLYLAQRSGIVLPQDLVIRPVALSGITIHNGKWLVGKRASHLTDYPGHLELVPSGSFDERYYTHGEIDYIAQGLDELAEEAGISKSYVNNVTPLMLVEDITTGIYEVCLEIHLKEIKLPEATVEYQMLAWWTQKDLQDAIESKTKIVPLSKYLTEI